MINFNSISASQFFQKLSQRDGWILNSYNNAFEINKSYFQNYKIREATGSGKVRLDDNAKLQTANNLAGLVLQEAEMLVLLPEFDVAQIQRVIERYKDVVSAKISDPDLQLKTQEAYQRAIDSLQQARETKTQWTSKTFTEKLAKGWITSRPNFKFYLKKEADGEITPYTSRKLFWIEKFLYGKATSSLEKKTMMQNLEKLLIRERPRIEGQRLNAKVIEANVERLAGRMIRNMTDVEKDEINQIVGRLKTLLGKAQVQINKDRASDPLLWIWNGIKWITLSPFRFTKWVAWDHIVYPLAKIPVTALDTWAVSPLVSVARSIKTIVFEYYSAMQFCVSVPIAIVKGTYNQVISPTIEMIGLIAKGILSVAKFPVSALNSYRQVTA